MEAQTAFDLLIYLERACGGSDNSTFWTPKVPQTFRRLAPSLKICVLRQAFFSMISSRLSNV